MQIIPQVFLDKLKDAKDLNKAAIDIDLKFEQIITNQSPVFFPEYTDHGISHFVNTLKMAVHLIDLEENEKRGGEKPVLDYLSPLNTLVLVASTLLHDIGMHIQFKGFKQLINGFFDDVKVDFFNDLTWKKEWENFMIEAKRFSGRQRINIFGDEQVIIHEVDFTKNSIDSDIQKKLIGEFIRRQHGRLAHEIALKGFPVQDHETIPLTGELNADYKDIIGLVARSHSMNVRDALDYIPDKFPADPHFPYEIEIPFLMCVLRIADYFQFDNTRTNAFIIKMRSFESPFSLYEHKTHLASEYFKTDDKDPETLYVHLKPTDGVMYNKLTNLFEDIQRELDTSFAITGEMYGRYKNYFKLRYRRINTNLKNKQVIHKFPYVVGVHKFEADADLFKLLVGPLYGYDPSFGIRELLQNAIDACIELKHKSIEEYEPLVEVRIHQFEDNYQFTITDNGKGMNIGEIKNYFLKAGSSFRNSMEWKIDYQTEENTPAIRRTGKFGIGVLASFLIGDSIEVTTKRYNETTGYKFSADLTHEFIEIKKENACGVGTTINIKITKEIYDKLRENDETKLSNLTKWYLLKYPKVTYLIDDMPITVAHTEIDLRGDSQIFEDSVQVDFQNFDSIIWSYNISGQMAINGIMIPGKYYYPTPYNYYNRNDRKTTIYDELDFFPFVSVLDRNNLIDLELNRNSIRGNLPFIQDLVESCKLDFLYKLLFFDPLIQDDEIDFNHKNYFESNYHGYNLQLDSVQFRDRTIFSTSKGYFFDNTFYSTIRKGMTHFRIYVDWMHTKKIKTLNYSTYSLIRTSGTNAERNIIRGDYTSYQAISKPEIYLNNHKSTAIAKHIRDDLGILEENKKYIVYSKGKWKQDNVSDLKFLFENNDSLAVHATNRSLSNDGTIEKLLKEHFPTPKLIPIEYGEKIKYVKTLSKELQKHIEEKRGINLG